MSVLASETFDETQGRRKLPAVQVGDPFMEKLLLEGCLPQDIDRVMEDADDLLEIVHTLRQVMNLKGT